MHPFHVERGNHVESGLALGGRPLHEQQVARRIRTDRAGSRQEVLRRPGDGRGRGVAQRHHRDAEARLSGPEIDPPNAVRLRHRDDLHETPVAHDRGIRHAQHAFEDREHILASNGSRRGERYGTLDPRVDHVVQLENVAEKGFRDRRNVGIFEIDLDAGAGRDRPHIRRSDPDRSTRLGTRLTCRRRLARRRRLRVQSREQQGAVRLACSAFASAKPIRQPCAQIGVANGVDDPVRRGPAGNAVGSAIGQAAHQHSRSAKLNCQAQSRPQATPQHH